jgi:hypothetical protein
VIWLCGLNEPSERKMVHGLHAREDFLLCEHKAGLGFAIVHILARVWFAPLLEKSCAEKVPILIIA